MSRPSETSVSPATARGGVDWRAVFAFPNPVNEYAARITAGLVVLLAAATLLTGFGWGLAIIAAGFWLRVLFGPRISPAGAALGQGSCSAARARQAGSRTAQAVRAGDRAPRFPLRRPRCSVAGLAPAAWVLLAVLIAAASLEAFAGFCLGCVDLRLPAAPGHDPGGRLRGLQQHFPQAVVTDTS